MSLDQMCQERISLHNNEHERVSGTCRHSTHDASHLHRVELADHHLENEMDSRHEAWQFHALTHPWDDEEAQGASDNEDENARDRDPRVDQRQTLSLPGGLVVEVDAESQHRHATADARDEGKRPPATASQCDARDDGEEESESAEHNGQRVGVHGRAGLFEDRDGVERDGVDARELVHHEVNHENTERLQTRRREESLKDFLRRRFPAKTSEQKLKFPPREHAKRLDSLF